MAFRPHTQICLEDVLSTLTANAYCKTVRVLIPQCIFLVIRYMLYIKPSRSSISSCIVFAGQVLQIANDEYTSIDCFTVSFLQMSTHSKASPSDTCATVLLAARPSCTWISLGCSSYPGSFPTNNSHVVHNEIHDIPREVRYGKIVPLPQVITGVYFKRTRVAHLKHSQKHRS